MAGLIKVEGNREEISCVHVDILLCHDDELESRRIAFILYLVPEWSAKDGGKEMVK